MESTCSFYFVSIPFRRHETLATMLDKGKHFISSRSFEYTNMYMPYVFYIAYCKPRMADDWQHICEEFVLSVKENMPSLLKKQKVHLILHHGGFYARFWSLFRF